MSGKSQLKKALMTQKKHSSKQKKALVDDWSLAEEHTKRHSCHFERAVAVEAAEDAVVESVSPSVRGKDIDDVMALPSGSQVDAEDKLPPTASGCFEVYPLLRAFR